MENFLHFDSYPINQEHASYFQETSPTDADQTPQFEEIIQDGKKRHLCLYPGCGKIFRFKSEIIRHHVIHFASRPYVCSFEGCNKSFKRPDALDSHMRIHIKDLPFTCNSPNCGMKFGTKAALKYHQVKHDSSNEEKLEESDKDYTAESPDDSLYTPYESLAKHVKTEDFSNKVAYLQDRQEGGQPIRVTKASSHLGDNSYSEFTAPAPRFATTIEWEMKNPDDLKELLIKECREGTENCELILKHILSENKTLKERLQQCNNVTNNFSKDSTEKEPIIYQPQELSEDLVLQVPDQIQGQVPEQSNFFADDSDSLFLAFLKEREDNYTESIF